MLSLSYLHNIPENRDQLNIANPAYIALTLTLGEEGNAPCLRCSESDLIEGALPMVLGTPVEPLFISLPSGSTKVHFSLESIS